MPVEIRELIIRANICRGKNNIPPPAPPDGLERKLLKTAREILKKSKNSNER